MTVVSSLIAKLWGPNVVTDAGILKVVSELHILKGPSDGSEKLSLPMRVTVEGIFIVFKETHQKKATSSIVEIPSGK